MLASITVIEEPIKLSRPAVRITRVRNLQVTSSGATGPISSTLEDKSTVSGILEGQKSPSNKDELLNFLQIIENLKRENVALRSNDENPKKAQVSPRANELFERFFATPEKWEAETSKARPRHADERRMRITNLKDDNDLGKFCRKIGMTHENLLCPRKTLQRRRMHGESFVYLQEDGEEKDCIIFEQQQIIQAKEQKLAELQKRKAKEEAEQSYILTSAEGVNKFRTTVAQRLGFQSWETRRSGLEGRQEQQIRQLLDDYLVDNGMDPSIWSDLDEICRMRNQMCHPVERKTTAQWFHNYAVQKLPPPGLEKHGKQLERAMQWTAEQEEEQTKRCARSPRITYPVYDYTPYFEPALIFYPLYYQQHVC